MVIVMLQTMKRPISLTLACFMAITLLIWASEKKLLFTTQELSAAHTSTDYTKTAYSPSNNTKKNDNSEGKYFDYFKTKEENSTELGKIDNISRMDGSAACNYAKGRWVADETRPLYSGSQCRQWISDKYACRLTQRPNFAYEGYRWQPFDCSMPNFDAPSFLTRMQDKTIAFVGDSLGKQQVMSLMCMAISGAHTRKVSNFREEYGFVEAPGASQPDGWAFRFPKTNTTILFLWSATLSDLVPYNASDPNTEIAMHLDRPPAFLQKYIRRINVLVFSTGYHWSRGKLNENRWVIHVNGKRNNDGNGDKSLENIQKAKNFTVHSIIKWVDAQITSHPNLQAFFRTISPRHFTGGDWNSGGSCDNSTPLTRGSEVVQDRSSDVSLEDALKGSKVKILDITALSDLRDEGHVSRYKIGGTLDVNDCAHWCLPGIPDTWNEVLIAQL